MSSLRDLDRAAERRWPRLMGGPQAAASTQALLGVLGVIGFQVAAIVTLEPQVGAGIAFGFAMAAASLGAGALAALYFRLVREERRR